MRGSNRQKKYCRQKGVTIFKKKILVGWAKIWIMYNAISLESIALQKFNEKDENPKRKHSIVCQAVTSPMKPERANDAKRRIRKFNQSENISHGGTKLGQLQQLTML